MNIKALLHILHTRWQRLRIRLRHLPWALRLVWQAAPGWTLFWAILLLMQSILPVITVYLTRSVVDHLVPRLGQVTSFNDMAPALTPIALLAGAMVLTQIISSIAGWLHTCQSNRVKDYMSGLVHAKAAQLDLAHFDSADYYDCLERARTDAANRPLALIRSVGQLVQQSLTLVAMLGVLLPFGWWIPLLLMVSTAPAFIVLVRITIRQHNWFVHNTANRRRTLYYDGILTAREAATELRLFNLTAHFRRAYQHLRRQMCRSQERIALEQAVAQWAAGLFGLLTLATVMGWTLWRSMRGEISMGDVVLMYQAFQNGQNLARTLLSNVNQLYSNMLFLDNLFTFLGLEPKVVDPPEPEPVPVPKTLRMGIRFEHVTFAYPGTDRVALDDFSCTLPAGKKVALVGTNGAGKSTVIKLLCRFYDPDAGQVLLDGTDLRQYPLTDLRRQITVLFQQPVQYHSTAAENIAIGDLMASPGDHDIRAAAEAAGADVPITRLPNGYDTILGKQFSGAELSGGEWQRLALARAFLRQAQIMVLDEPTSAMDSWAEAAWLERFHKLAEGCTVLMVTHRFTTAMHADIIYVMDQGHIVESGTHEDLLALGGHYAQSWLKQMHTRHKDLPSNGTSFALNMNAYERGQT
ncbi:ABC transporter ATP-binding protein [Candidatus Entotheonella palauensis]|uniref:ABC transporter ATP-binding protein n=1 Tax=Candidatus Entotheonella palauensis TaxID=93172 RepID=UPI0021179A1C|nr:ABC transporter ATP-binding protein [Candidatus Entotheonella palauensis]